MSAAFSSSMASMAENQVEQQLLQQLQGMNYQQATIRDYADLTANFRTQLARCNQEMLDAKKGSMSFSDAEFGQVMRQLEGLNVYDAAQQLRAQLAISLDNGATAYLNLLHPNFERNIFQVAHQIKMERGQLNTIEYNNRYDVTILVNGLPLVQIELKRPGVELEQAINQINRYRQHSLTGLFTFVQLFVVSNSTRTKYGCNQNRKNADGSNIRIGKEQLFFWSDADNNRIENLTDFAASFLERKHLIELITKFMVIQSTAPTMMVMRPYQIYAVKAAIKRVLVEQQNGYIFACTGSGKTLTSFKLAQLLRDEANYDQKTGLEPAEPSSLIDTGAHQATPVPLSKIIFLVDRKDLDDQTIREYNSFEHDCVDRSCSTSHLVAQLKKDDAKLIVTTIQKLHHALNSERHHKVMERLKEQRIVFIIDECHRSQFGDMHAEIKRHFAHALYIGFTGTPIMEANKSKQRTTADVFASGELEPCLHKYLIKDAIADNNVLPFSVEHKNTILGPQEQKQYSAEELEDAAFCSSHGIDRHAIYHSTERLERVAQDLLAHHDQKTQQRSFTAMFAVDSIETLGRYYDLLRDHNAQRPPEQQLKIAAIFSCNANEGYSEGDQQQDGPALLARCMVDYNQCFGTSFRLDNFDGYRSDIMERIKQQRLPQVDLLLVVDMLLTGFDARPLNTLYLDKTLQWHGLLQAYSRTNRVYNLHKQCGQIVTYRNIKLAQDNALRLFSGDGDPNQYLSEDYEQLLEQWHEQSVVLKTIVATPAAVAQLQSEDDISAFVAAFKKLPRTLGKLTSLSQFTWSDLAAHGLSDAEYQDYKAHYVDLYNQAQEHAVTTKTQLELDYEIDLVCTDHINVAYILRLLENIRQRPQAQQASEIDKLRADMKSSDNPDLQRKQELIDTFVVEAFPHLDPDTTVQEAFDQFARAQRDRELRAFAEQEQLAPQIVTEAFDDFELSGHLSRQKLRQQFKDYNYRFGISELKQVTQSLNDFILQTALRYKDLGD